MYKTILLAYNGSEAGQKALLESKALAAWGQARLHLIAVMPIVSSDVVGEGFVFTAQDEKQQRQAYQKILEEGLQQLGQAGHEVEGELLVGEPIHEICACALRIRAELIVVGHKHRSGWLDRWWSGSVSKSLIEEAPCSVLVSISGA